MLKKHGDIFASLLVSLTVHGLVFAWLFIGNAHPKAVGIVSVEFIQPVSHNEPPPSPRLRRKSDIPAPKEAPEPTPAPAQQTASSVAADPRAVASETSIFVASVTHLIDKAKIYPRDSLRREEEGKVVIGISIERDGKLLEAKIEEPSVFSNLNEAALQTVHAVGLFPQVPAILPAPIHLHVPLNFRIQRN